MELEKQKTFILNNNVVISSKFQSGNLSQAMEKGPNHYNLWIGPDHNSSYKTWFYFSIEGIEPNTIVTFSINNMNNQLKLFKQDHLPVFREQENQNWQRIKIPIQQNGIVKAQDGYQLTFKHNFNKKSKHYFAFSYPWTSIDCDRFINNLIESHPYKIFAKYESFAVTPCKRNVKILTLTKTIKSNQWKQIEVFSQDQSSMRPIVFESKKGIFISARVHPGEVASSHILNGVLEKILDGSEQSKTLLQNFVFYIVPMINPDGVDEGNFRTDSKGKNLNRCYTSPNKFQEPQIYTIKKFLLKMIDQNHIEFCLDLHAHVNKQGVFIYGNSIQDLKSQVQVCLFPKILAYNCPYFDYEACNFSQKNMSSKDKADDLSKQGASRVAIFKQTGLKACWTLECNYNSCKYSNQLKNPQDSSLKSVSNGVLTEKLLPMRKEQKKFMNIHEFNSIGFAICQSILDYYDLRPRARYWSGKIKNRENFITNLGVEVLMMIPFRFDNYCRKVLTSISSNMNLSQNLNKVKDMLKDLQIGTNTKFSPKQTKKASQKEIQKPTLRKLPSQQENQTKPVLINRRGSSLINKKQSIPKPGLKIDTKQGNSNGKIIVPISKGLTGDYNKAKQVNIGVKLLLPKPSIPSSKKV